MNNYESSKTLDNLYDSVIKLCNKLKNLPIAGTFFDDLPWAIALLDDWAHKKYTEVPIATIISLSGALVYLIGPIDLIPSFIPLIGQLDDIVVISLALRAAHNDIADYREWKQSNLEEDE